jgi:putative oxidoreductase
MDKGREVKLLRWVCRLGLAALFVYAAVPKLWDPAGFVQDLSHYRVVPEALLGPLSIGLPALELCAGLALLTPAYMRGGAALLAGLLATFAVAMAQAKLRGINLECGCFGAGSGLQVSWSKVAIDAGLAMLALWLAFPSHTPGAAAGAPPQFSRSSS